MKKHLFVILVATVCLWTGAAPLVVGIADMCSTTNAVNVQSTYVAAVAAAGNTPLVLNLRRDAWEFLLLDEAEKRRLPVFGICRGCQVINVYFGGTLWQDLPSERPGEIAHRSKKLHPIRIVQGSRLAKSLRAENLMVNTSHHQAVKDLAPGFRAVAFAPDGVVEAIESNDLPVAGVQFHPERLLVQDGRAEFRELFKQFLVKRH